MMTMMMMMMMMMTIEVSINNFSHFIAFELHRPFFWGVGGGVLLIYIL